MYTVGNDALCISLAKLTRNGFMNATFRDVEAAHLWESVTIQLGRWEQLLLKPLRPERKNETEEKVERVILPYGGGTTGSAHSPFSQRYAEDRINHWEAKKVER